MCWRTMAIVTSMVLMMIGGLQGMALGESIYVDPNAIGVNDGTSWSDAYNFMQDALADAVDGDEIRVAQGVYRPDEGSGITPGDRGATFQLKNGVAVKGGYAGVGASSPDVRDIELNETILSGDLSDNDAEVADPFDLWNEPTRAENSRHVVTGSGTYRTAVLEGFTITGGNAHEPGGAEWDDHRGWGGGMFNMTGSPTVSSCTLLSNSADWWGGGMINEVGSSPKIANCKFIANGVRVIFGPYSSAGGGLANEYGSNPTIENCVFIGNKARQAGGMYSWNSSPALTNCEFIRNGALYGGAMQDSSNSSSSSTLSHCIFRENRATTAGGLFNWSCSPTLVNCMFIDNVAEGGVGGGMHSVGASNPTLVNCIMWGNTPSQISSSAQVRYSDIEGGWPGTGNTSEDPAFADPDNGDYHLKSEAGRWDPNDSQWEVDEMTSPCIDVGDPVADWHGEFWPHGGWINMGAYGGTAEASMSSSDVGNIADFDNSGIVDYGDFSVLSGVWQIDVLLLKADMNRDGHVGMEDLLIFANNW